MANFDYTLPAELFPGRAHNARFAPVGYKRFGCAADAVRFAIEDLQAEFLAGAYLEVDEERFDRHGIRQLYESADYPLPRRAEDGGRAVVHLDTALAAKRPRAKYLSRPSRKDVRRSTP